MSTRFHAARPALAVLLFVAAATPPLSAGRLVDRLVVRVYDLTGLPAAIRVRAVDVARAIVGDVGLIADWQDCTATAAQRRCAPARGADDLVVRIVAGATPGADDRPATLGYAVVEPGTGAGALATIFVGRVEHVARRSGGARGDLLGRAIAHEVGHLLLGTNRHAATGLMRERWTDQEIVRNRREDWLFSSSDRGRLRDQWPAVDAVAGGP